MLNRFDGQKTESFTAPPADDGILYRDALETSEGVKL
jgi:hypothetical protein